MRKTYLDVLTSEVRYLLREAACVIDRTWWHLVCADDPVVDGYAVIVLTKRGCLMNNTSTILSGDIGVVHDAESSVLELAAELSLRHHEHNAGDLPAQ
jgi:hypothetical protein